MQLCPGISAAWSVSSYLLSPSRYCLFIHDFDHRKNLLHHNSACRCSKTIHKIAFDSGRQITLRTLSKKFFPTQRVDSPIQKVAAYRGDTGKVKKIQGGLRKCETLESERITSRKLKMDEISKNQKKGMLSKSRKKEITLKV